MSDNNALSRDEAFEKLGHITRQLHQASACQRSQFLGIAPGKPATDEDGEGDMFAEKKGNNALVHKRRRFRFAGIKGQGDNFFVPR